MVTSLLTVFNETQLALAESGTTSSSASSQTTKAPIGLLIAYWICNSRKRKAIGGWLLFYYMQLFIGTAFSILMILLSLKTLAENLNIANWGNETMQYFPRPPCVLQIAQKIVAYTKPKVFSSPGKDENLTAK